MGLLRTIAIIFLVYFVLRILGKFVLPWLFKSYVKKKQAEMEEKLRNHSNYNKQEGEVTIKKNPANQDQSSDKGGDFIDFEEVE